MVALQEQCDGSSIYWSTGEENKEAFHIFLCAHMHKLLHIFAPPLPSNIFCLGDASVHQERVKGKTSQLHILVAGEQGMLLLMTFVALQLC